jgi:cellulose synthase/poly-beta-1,6-N-acetylglucosamine synthase-like glycosyltransferase
MATYSSIIIYISLFFGLYYQIFILVTFFETENPKIQVKKASIKSRYLPTVSIIVPCFNEEKTLEKTVRSLLELNYPKDKLSIIIVDDGSKDSTYEKALAMVQLSYNVKAFTQKNGGKFTALNFGIKNSNTKIVGCLDADSTVHPDSLLKMVPYFKGKDIVAVTPAMKVYEASTILQKMQRVEYNIGIFLKKIMGKLDAIHVTPGPFSLFKKDVFEKIGYFRHAHNTEDMEIAFRIQNHNYRIANCPTAFVYTITPSNLKKLYRQRTRWTYGFIKNALDYKHMFLNPKYGNLGMLTLPFAVISSIIALLLFGSTIYNLISYIVEHIQKYLTIGFSLRLGSIDPFFFNTNTVVILAVVMLAISISLILISWRLAEGKARIGRDILYFITLYGFIAPFWLAKASFNVLASRTTPWR